MIVHPHFFAHWKTRQLATATKHEMSALWLQKLWAYCQLQKTDTFTLNPKTLHSLCGVAAEITAEIWFESLRECNWISGTRKEWLVVGWREHNAGLVAAWENGKKPKLKQRVSHGLPMAKPPLSHGSPDAKPPVSHGSPDAEPPLSHGLPDGKRRRSDQMGLDRIGLDGTRDDQIQGSRRSRRERRPNDLTAVTAYADELGASQIEAQKFFDYFESTGWTRGRGTPLADWRAAFRGWLRRAAEDDGDGQKFRKDGPPTKPFDPNKPNAHTGGLRDLSAEPLPEEPPKEAGA